LNSGKSVPLLQIDRLSLSFGEERILDDINVRCVRGEFASLLGASGCGKSTLLRLIAKLKKPSSGTITFGDLNPQQIGFVFQQPTLLPWLSAINNVALPLNVSGQMKSKQRRQIAAEALELVGLNSSDHKKIPSKLSGGMQMRVSLARAFVTKPSLILMDEPFSALDEVLRQQLCETTLELWKREGWTTLFVTHNVSEAVFLSQRIFILAGKPATIVDVIEVPFVDRTRSLRSSPQFMELVAHVGARLREVVESDEGKGAAEQ